MANGEPKQIIVVRKDLNMRRGKQIAQGCHASLKVVLDYGNIQHQHCDVGSNIVHTDLLIPISKHQALEEWITGRFTKICVYVNSEQELLDIYNQAKQANILCSLITDAGLTEFNGVPTNTVVAIGPDYPENIDPITKHLKLL